MLEESYRAGRITRGAWHRPDGTVLVTSEDKDGSIFWYYVREDGTIRLKQECKDFPGEDFGFALAHGTTTYYRPDGSVEKKQEFRRGQPMGKQPP